MAIPTQHLPARLIYRDGVTLQLASVEFFSMSRRVWVRGQEVSKDGLTQIDLAGLVLNIKRVEHLRDDLIEIILDI